MQLAFVNLARSPDAQLHYKLHKFLQQSQGHYRNSLSYVYQLNDDACATAGLIYRYSPCRPSLRQVLENSSRARYNPRFEQSWLPNFQATDLKFAKEP